MIAALCKGLGGCDPQQVLLWRLDVANAIGEGLASLMRRINTEVNRSSGGGDAGSPREERMPDGTTRIHIASPEQLIEHLKGRQGAF